MSTSGRVARARGAALLRAAARWTTCRIGYADGIGGLGADTGIRKAVSGVGFRHAWRCTGRPPTTVGPSVLALPPLAELIAAV